MPLLPLPRLDRHALRLAVDDLHQAIRLADQVGAFLDGGAVGRGAGAYSVFVVGVGVTRGLCRRRDDAGGQPVERCGQQRLERHAVLARPAGIGRGRAVDAAPQRVLAQHHLRMLGEVAVHLDDG